MTAVNTGTLTRTLVALPAALAISTGAMAEPRKFIVDDEHFSIVFEIMHIGYAPVMGMFREVEGQFVYDEEARELKSGQLVFQSDSVFTNHKKRDEHVRNEDFLNSEEYPEITYTVTGFETTGENTGKVTGDLEMLGQTRPVVLDVTLNKSAVYPFGHEEYTLGISASTTLKRSEWGMTYGIEQAMVGDEVTLRFGFEAIRESGGLF
ncbi:Polyisoprenoid-binding protein YceI [Marinobacter gudaonensis]|uniref:Polyisoprenoid-binding protein YceI n=1 Tax=Marinobacter gudaonensis TaxID=375760 RepID=A0A1I6GE29_9GAMM|nr:YceI family protein [Marinobacter gudaonensis]SFR40439.1 Polyisoprenoid-binding protein YceI [Marinobacter gudaonensis]